MTTIAIIGGGLAGAKTAEALREQDFDGEVLLFGSEEHLPYERPPLSKDYLSGNKSLPDFTVHTADWHLDHRVDVRPGTTVRSVDRESKSIVLPDDSRVGYDKLVLATGSSARRLDLPGADAAGVHLLRSYDDAAALSEAIGNSTRLAIVGGGWIGLEVAASARTRRIEVAIAESAALPLQAIMGDEVAEVFASLHREHDVDLRTSVSVDEIISSGGAATGIRLADGATIEADTVLVAAGAVSELGLAQAAGLATGDGGVLVDAGLRSSDPDIFAVGDIANAMHPILGHRVRVQHWANALNQPAVAATNLLGGDAQYTNLPYFYTDQYDLGMEYVGLADADDEVVIRGDLAAREFVAVWCSSEGRVKAGMQVNIWDQLDDLKALIGAAKPVDTDRLADSSIPLSQLH